MLCITATSSNGFCTVSAEIISVCVIDFIGRKGGFVVGVDNGCVLSLVTRWSVPSQLISTVSLEAEHHRKPKGTNFGWGVSRAIIVVSSNKCCAMRSCSVCWMALNKCLKLTECNYIFMLLSICSTVTSHVLCPRCPGCPISECTDNVQLVIQNAYTTSPLSHFAFALRYQRWSRLLCAGLHSFDPLRSCPRFVFLEMLA